MGLTLAGCSQAEMKSESVEKEISLSTPLETLEEIDEPTQAKELAIEPNQSITPTVRSADSHVHGGAMLSIVSEADRVFVELETPLYNLLGFEYEPQTSEEKARVSDIETQLGQPQNLIVFNKEAKCIYNEINTQVSLFDTPLSDDAIPHGAEDSHSHGHDHNHKNEQAHETEMHAQSETDEHDHSSGHKDIILSYSLTCGDLSKLKTVEVKFFEDFPNFTKLDLVYLGPSQQTSTELSPSKSKADLTR